MKKLIEGSKGYYVTEEGVVYGMRGFALKPDVSKVGYERVVIYYKDGSKSRESVHRFVAKHFIPNPENKPVVNHKDGNKLNNNVENLEWCTHKENSEHASDNGLFTFCGENHHEAKYTESYIRQVCELLQDGFRNKEISERLGINKSMVSMIRRGQSWKHVSKEYKFNVVRAKRLSEKAVRWICERFQEGLTVLEVYEITKNRGITKSSLYQIKSRQSYVTISKDYDF